MAINDPQRNAADAVLLRALRRLCGYYEDGSGTAVTIMQDDATREWVLKVGQRSFYAPSFESVISEAALATPDDTVC
jgi:hypothetical protein